jgi:hypothetical protein
MLLLDLELSPAGSESSRLMPVHKVALKEGYRGNVRNAATTILHYPVTAHNINLHETFG